MPNPYFLGKASWGCRAKAGRAAAAHQECRKIGPGRSIHAGANPGPAARPAPSRSAARTGPGPSAPSSRPGRACSVPGRTFAATAAPATYSTGPSTRVPRLASAKKTRDFRMVPTAQPMSRPRSRNSVASSLTASGGKTVSPKNRRHSLPAIRPAVAGCSSEILTRSDPDHLPFCPRTVFSPSSWRRVFSVNLSSSMVQPVNALAASLTSRSE